MKYYIYTFGCKVNRYETQLIADKLKSDGYLPADAPEDADIIVFNSCTVTENADKECLSFLRKVSKFEHNPKIILTGCMSKRPIADLSDKIEIVADKKTLYKNADTQSIETFDNRSRAFLKIQDGCDSFCSYCIVPFARNELWSKPAKTVLAEIETLVKTGYSEIVLTGIHVGKYSGGLSNLLEKIVKIPLVFRARISSIEINEVDDKLIALMKENPDKICAHLHIPLQSGSDDILKLMNRKYLAKNYADKVVKILKEFPNLALTADIITGFPGETEQHHKETCDFLKSLAFSRLHIFRYSDRPGTKASEFANKVPPEILKQRSEELFEIDKQKRKEFLKKNFGKKRKAVMIGKNKALSDNYIESGVLKLEQRVKGIIEITINEHCKI